MQVLKFLAIGRRLVERHIIEILVGYRNVETVAKLANGIHIHLFLLVRRVLTLAGRAHAIALDGFGQNDRRLIRVTRCGVVGGMNLDRIVPAAIETPDLFV